MGQSTRGKKYVYKWYKLLTEDREDVSADAHPGYPALQQRTKTLKLSHHAIFSNVLDIPSAKFGSELHHMSITDQLMNDVDDNSDLL